MTVSSLYYDLRSQIAYSVGSNERHDHLLQNLKHMFKDDINSERKYEKIKTINYLLELLETRNILSENNVEPLRKIAEKLHNSDLLRKISDYENSLESEMNNSNDYVPVAQPVQEISEQTPLQSYFSRDIYGTVMSDIKRKRLYRALVDGLGIYWRDVGRWLRIKEGTIDKIDKNNACFESKSIKLLEAYEKIADPQRWFFVLCDALERARRKDLSRTLTEIMSMNI